MTSSPVRSTLAGQRFLPAFLLTAALATLAQWLKAVTPQGAVAGAGASMLLFLGGGPGAFAALTAVFLLTWASTRLGFERKQRLAQIGRASCRERVYVLV